MRRVAARDPDALAELYDRDHQRAYSLAQRICRDLAYSGELSGEEIAELLDLPLGTVKSRLRLALGKLRRAFERVAPRPLRNGCTP